MIYADFVDIAKQCAPSVQVSTMAAIASVESGYNPFAIGVVGGQLTRQPANKDEAVATAKMLELQGYNFSMGVGQLNRFNLPRFKLTYDTVFDPCQNLRAASQILSNCFIRAKSKFAGDQEALQAAFSCYYSGNFATGFTQDFNGQPSYVQKVLNHGGHPEVIAPIAVIRQAVGKAHKAAKSEKAAEAEPLDETAAAMVFK